MSVSAAAKAQGRTGKPADLPVARSRARFIDVVEVPVVCDGAAQFARFVRENLRGPVLTYSQRLSMVNEAERRGIGRFDANLILAAVLHRSGMRHEMPELSPRRLRHGWLLPALTFAVLQGAILAGGWWLLR